LLQFIAGIGIPVNLAQESLTTGYVFKAQYYLPYRFDQWKPTRINLFRHARDVSNHTKVDEYGQVYESYGVEAEVKSVSEIETEDGEDNVRWMIYQAVEWILNSKDIDGKQCVMRAICEASRVNFGLHSGFLGEIFHVLFV
jgi:hypothetical protein